MQSALHDLATAKPHEEVGVRWAPVEWRAYCAGYYKALCMAVKVTDLARTRFALMQRTRRLARRKARQE